MTRNCVTKILQIGIIHSSGSDRKRGAIIVRRCMLLVTLILAALAASADAQTPGPSPVPSPAAWTQVGVLTCKLNPSIGFIIAGHQSMQCNYASAASGPPQAYEGAINTVGIDIGVTAGGVLAWTVFAPTQGAPAGALAGEYRRLRRHRPWPRRRRQCSGWRLRPHLRPAAAFP
jgi:uncharacterized protein DUF992